MKNKQCLIIFTIGGKGGVGKSWAIGLVVQWLEMLGVVFALYDCDDETSTTTRFFPSAKFVAIRSSVEIDRIIQVATEGQYDVIVIDLPARAGDEFSNWFGLIPWEELKAIGVRFTALALISGSKDSIECVLRWLDFLGEHVAPVLVLNRRDDLSIYESSRARLGFKAAGYPEIELPPLVEKLAAELDKANWTIATALTTPEPHYLTELMCRARLRRYRDQVFLQFEKIKKYLLP